MVQFCREILHGELGSAFRLLVHHDRSACVAAAPGHAHLLHLYFHKG